ncbi:MAG: hypothetical protein LBC86_02290 [Oscillospiraceae bacterium]|jgi:hypothetical protein|nr:hypothetical protein [Oscillospiraceae bacterium]
MIAQYCGQRFNYVDDSNKFAQDSAYSRMKSEKANTGLDDSQRVYTVEKQSGYDPDGISKDSEARKAAHKEHLEKMFNFESNSSYELGIFKGKSDTEIVNDYIKNHGGGSHGSDCGDCDCVVCKCETCTGCGTCESRRYVDQSHDSAVSFQMPTQMSPMEARYMVRAHEMEHVRREQQKVIGDSNRRIISQQVRIQTSTCAECGVTYVSGGTTTTATRYSNPAFKSLFMVGSTDKFNNDFNATA